MVGDSVSPAEEDGQRDKEPVEHAPEEAAVQDGHRPRHAQTQLRRALEPRRQGLRQSEPHGAVGERPPRGRGAPRAGGQTTRRRLPLSPPRRFQSLHVFLVLASLSRRADVAGCVQAQDRRRGAYLLSHLLRRRYGHHFPAPPPRRQMPRGRRSSRRRRRHGSRGGGELEVLPQADAALLRWTHRGRRLSGGDFSAVRNRQRGGVAEIHRNGPVRRQLHGDAAREPRRLRGED